MSHRRLFLDPDPSLRARRATDGLLLASALVGLVGLGALEKTHSAAEAALVRFFAALPGWFDSGWRLLYDLPLLWAVVLVAVALAQRRRRVAGSAGLAVAHRPARNRRLPAGVPRGPPGARHRDDDRDGGGHGAAREPGRHLDDRPGHRGHAGRGAGEPVRNARRAPGRSGRRRGRT